jgi:hypothetical protein
VWRVIIDKQNETASFLLSLFVSWLVRGFRPRPVRNQFGAMGKIVWNQFSSMGETIRHETTWDGVNVDGLWESTKTPSHASFGELS